MTVTRLDELGGYDLRLVRKTSETSLTSTPDSGPRHRLYEVRPRSRQDRNNPESSLPGELSENQGLGDVGVFKKS